MTAKTLSRRSLLRGVGATLALPPLQAMFNGRGTAYGAEDNAPVPTRFVLWFNGNGIPEKYWVPAQTGEDIALSPCLAPLTAHWKYVTVLSGLANTAAGMRGQGNGHTNSMSGLMSGTGYTGRGAGGPSIDQVIASRLGGDTRFRSIQVGVASESFGESMQRNMSWAAANRPLAPEMLPNRLFDRLFGQKELGWMQRQKSILDALTEDAKRMSQNLGAADRMRLDEHLASLRDLERAIASLPPAYKAAERPDVEGDMRDYPRLAKLQADLLVHALASGQTRVASFMLTKCQSLTRFPWLGHTVLRHHDYTHYKVIPGTEQPAQLALRDICRWHVEEFAYLVGKLRAVPEGAGNLLDNTCAVFVHEHAEGNDHKNVGMGAVVAGCAHRLRAGSHRKVAATFGDLYWTLANDVVGAGIKGFPTASRRLPEILRA
ncbi:MAG: DUF1552 domain-containing protein [Deltaproteobacteria bacterium]|nr:DUF1552 domain-containing protein [Deltaproteobacteria bacterium]